MTIKIPAGSLKFNKVGLYAVHRSATGEVSGEPFLFGQVIMPEPQLIVSEQTSSTSQSTVSNLIIDYQLDFSAIDTDFEAVFYGSPNEYWERVTNASGQYGLLYEGSVFITNTLGVEDRNPSIVPNPDDVGVAKTLMSTFHTVNKANPAEERVLPQLCLQYVDYPTNIAGVPEGSQFPYRIRSTFRTNENGNLELDMYGGCNADGFYSFMPKTDEVLSLGKPSNRWRSIYLSTGYETNLGEYVLIDGPDTDDDAELVVSGSRWNYIENRDTTGFMVMQANDLLDNRVYGMGYFGNSSVYVGPHYDDRDLVADELSKKDNYFYSYGNISNYMGIAITSGGDTVMEPYQLGIRSTGSGIAMYSISDDYISRYEVGSAGNSDIDGDSEQFINDMYTMASFGDAGNRYDGSNGFFFNNVTGQNGTDTIFNKLMPTAEWESTKDTLVGDDVATVRASLYGGNFVTGNPDANNKTDILLTSRRFIYTFGDIMPMVDGFNNLGANSHGFARLYLERLVGQSYAGDRISENRYTEIVGHLYPNRDDSVIGRGPNGNRWAKISVDVIGDTNDYVGNFS